MINKVIAAIRNTGTFFYRPVGTARYERKFVVSHFNLKQIESAIKHHPLMFREIYKKRQINNIYLDTIDLKTYFDNVYGNTHRVKIRIRWYGSTFGNIEHPVLEMKIKTGLAGKKQSFPLNPFSLEKDFGRETLVQMLEKSTLPDYVREKLTAYRPVLLNCYSRKYFASSDKTVRITIDDGMAYWGLSSRNNNFIRKHIDRQNIIVEMKYGLESAYVASDISQHFPHRMTKSSKYVNGIELFNSHLST